MTDRPPETEALVAAEDEPGALLAAEAIEARPPLEPAVGAE